MDKSGIITLEKPRYKLDALNQNIPDGGTTRDIFCNIKDVTRTEWVAAAQGGFRAAYCITVWADEYQGETVAILDGVRYTIYRTYRPNTEDISVSYGTEVVNTDGVLSLGGTTGSVSVSAASDLDVVKGKYVKLSGSYGSTTTTIYYIPEDATITQSGSTYSKSYVADKANQMFVLA